MAALNSFRWKPGCLSSGKGVASSLCDIIFVCICSSTQDFLHFPSNHIKSPIFTNTFHPVIPRSLTAFVRIGLPLGCSQNCAAANIGGFTAMPLLSFGTLNLHSISFDPQPFRRILPNGFPSSIKLCSNYEQLVCFGFRSRRLFLNGVGRGMWGGWTLGGRQQGRGPVWSSQISDQPAC